MSPLVLEGLYDVMVGMAGFTIGLAAIIAVGNVQDALAYGEGELWFWAMARLGWALIVTSLMPLILLARSYGAPFNWQSWVFLFALALEMTSFSAIYLMRLRKHRRYR